MTISMQSKVLDAIEKVATEAGYEVAKQAEYANTGSLYIQRAGSFTTVMTVAYNFQNTDATIYTDPLPTAEDGARPTASWPGSMPHQPPAGWIAFRVSYGNGGSIEQVLDYIRKILTREED